MNNPEFDRIQAASQEQPNNCSCNVCANMCKRNPCLGTPSDILRLINNGYVQELDVIQWAAGIFVGIPVIAMVQLRRLENGHCIMFEDGLCKLHTSGMKPTEGKLVSHSSRGTGKGRKNVERHLTVLVARTWEDTSNDKTVTLIVKALKKVIEHDERTT